MALNNLGLGFSLTADDAASLQIMRVAGSLGALKVSGDNAAMSFDNVAGRMRDASTGRFAKKPEGMLNPQFIGEVSGQLQSMGQKFALVGAGIVGGLGYASMKASEFSKAIALVASEADLSIFPQEEMARVAQELAGKFGRLPTQEAGALYKAVALGANTATKATQLMTGSNLLAVAGNADLELTMNALGGALNAYGGDMSKATDFSDILFTTMKNGNTTVGELAASIGHITSAAANLNIPFQEVMGAVSVMTNKGVAAAEAVTGLKAAFQSIVHPTSEAAAEAARLGIKFTQAELRAKGLPAFLDQITKSSKFTAESMSLLFAGEGANAIAQVTGDGHAFADVMKEMGSRAGATAKGFEILSNTTDFQAQKLNSLKDSALIMIGDAIKPMTVGIMKFGVSVLEWFTKLPKPVIAFGTRLAAVAGVVFTFLGGLMTAGAAIGGLIVAAKAIAIGVGVAAAAMILLTAALIPAIAYAALLYYVWTRDIGGLATRVKGWVADISLAFEALGQLFSDGGFSGKVQEDLSKAENKGIKTFAISVFLWFNRIKNFVSGVGSAFETGMKTIEPTFTAISQALGRLWSRFQPVGESLSSAKDKFDAFGGAGQKTGGMLVTVIDKVAKVVLGAISFVDGFMETWNGMSGVFDAFKDIGKQVVAIFSDLFTQLTGSGASASTTADFWRGFGNALGWVANVGLTIVGAQLRVLGGVLSWVGGLVMGVWTFFSGLFDYLGSMIGVIVKLFQGDFGGALKLSETASINLAVSCVQAFTKIAAGAAGMVDSLAKIFKVDLGLKAKVEGVGNGLAAKMQANAPASTTTTPVTGSSNPALMPAGAQAQGQAQNTAALTAAVAGSNAKPVDVTVKSQLVVDGAVLAEATQKGAQQASGRAFAPSGTGHLT